jgi:sugar lactone lactonase YvrE
LVALAAVVGTGVMGSTLAMAAPARASVYWANQAGGSGTTIGRAATDGSGANQSFISGASAPIGVAVDGRHIYWANEKTNSIGRANLDGTGVNPGFIGGAQDPFGVAVDAQHIYWTNVQSDSIGRANLDGSGAENSFITGASDPEGIAVDGQHIYWANAFSGVIGRANLDGSGVDQSFINATHSPRGVAVDAQHIYWTELVEGTIGRANLDGSGANDSFITGAADSPIGIAVDSQHIFWANATANSLSRANLDGSGVVSNLVSADDPYGVAADNAPPPHGPPAVSGEQVLGVGQTSATVGAVVGGATGYHVEWGPTASYGSAGPDFPTSGPGDQAVAAQLTGLSPGTAYHWRIVATNGAGTAAGTDQTLTTSATGPAPTATFTITPPAASGARTLISAAGSSGNGSPIVSYKWDWNDDGTFDATCNGSSPVAMPVYMQAGTYHVGLRVTSADGQSAFSTSTVTVSHVPTGGAPGVGLVAGYGCGSLIHNAVCTNHIEWDLIVADALDNGCFTEVPVDPWTTGTSVCRICAADAAAGEPVAYAPPPVAGWFHRTDAKTWQATGRVLVNGVTISPLTELIGVGGRQGRHFVQQQTSVLINEVDDSIYAASADVAVKGTGHFPDTTLERGARIFAKLPVSAAVPPVLLGAGDRPRLVRAFAPRVHADGDQTANPCEDPGVQGLPELAQFNDPASVGSKISGFSLSGPDPVTVHVVDGHVVVCVDVELPPGTFGPCLSGDPFVLKATLIADENGLVLQDLHAHLPCAVIAGVVFEDVFFDYDAQGQQWSAQGTVEAVPGIALHGDIEFAGGVFQRAIVSLGNQTVPVAPWQVTEASLEVDPDSTSGTVRLSLWPPIPGLNVSLLDISGQFTANWGASPPLVMVSGQISTLGAGLVDGWIKYQPTLGDLSFHAMVQKDLLGVLRVDAKLDGAIWHLDPLRFNVYGGATISVFDLVDVDGQMVVSDNGIGACVGVGFWKIQVQMGGWIRWSNLSWHPAFAGCDISDAQDAGVSADVSRVAGRATAAQFTVPVRRGTRAEIIGVTGGGAPPAVALVGPRGQRLLAPADHPVSDAGEVVLHDPTTNNTFVIVHAPQAGRWTVTPLPGSAPITAVRFATTLPDVSVHARVIGAGRRRAVEYRIRRITGQTVMLFERGPGWERPIGRLAGGGSGRIGFAPAPAPGGRRQIVAEVDQYGHPRAERVVASYIAPPPAPLGRPARLHATRRRTSLVVSWRGVPGAMAYLVSVTAGRKHPITTVVQGRQFTFRGITPATAALIAVTALDYRRRGARSSLHVPPAEHRRESR